MAPRDDAEWDAFMQRARAVQEAQASDLDDILTRSRDIAIGGDAADRAEHIDALRWACKNGERPWRELALYELAWWGLIIYHTWKHLTQAERTELGVMGARSARRELDIR